MVGVEPTLPSGNTILSRGRLPVPPHRHVNYLVLSDHLHTRGNWRDAVEGYSLIIFAETQIYQGLQLIRKTFTHWILSPVRLPISPLRRIYFVHRKKYYTTIKFPMSIIFEKIFLPLDKKKITKKNSFFVLTINHFALIIYNCSADKESMRH